MLPMAVVGCSSSYVAHSASGTTGGCASTSGRCRFASYAPVSGRCRRHLSLADGLVVRTSTNGQHGGGPPGGPRKPSGSKHKHSQLAEWVRRTPGLNRLYDGTLVLGDLVMLTATEVSSERISWEVLPQLLAVMVASWLFAAMYLNDYDAQPPMSDNWYLGMLGPPFQAIISATLTWAMAVTIMLAAYSVLVANHYLDAAPILDGLGTEDLSPQMEVMVATMITMSCWRGIAARLRWN